MCGICGYIDNKAARSEIIHEMTDSMFHRGPDSKGVFMKNNFAFGMRRLSIIDLNSGSQPIFNHDKSKCIVFNGEIYNFPELKKELLMLNMKFNTKTDTEVILLGYEIFGVEYFSKLNGMFAICIYDDVKHEIIIARDRLGKKPLFYYNNKGLFAFGSEIKAIFKHPTPEKLINFTSLDNLFQFKHTPGEETIYNGISKVRQGHYLKINNLGIITEYLPYWELKNGIINRQEYNYDESKILLREKLISSVKRRLISDVPIGVFLSGGIDSSIITGIVSEISSKPINTFSIGFKDKSFDETRFARIMAEKYKTNHHEFIVEQFKLFDLIDNLVYFLDEPTGDYSIIPTYFVSKYTRSKVKVALSGTGADELFLGYDRYRVHHLNSIMNFFPLHFLDLVAKIISFLPHSSNKNGIIWRLEKILKTRGMNRKDQYLSILTLLDMVDRQKLYTNEVSNEINHEKKSIFAKKFEEANEYDFLKQLSYVDINTILIDDYLVKEDRMSMANSLEVRSPFLDYEIVEFVFNMNSNFKLSGGKPKYILKDAFKDILPDKIRNRGKYGFEAPFGNWIRNDLRRDTYELFNDSYLVKNHIFNKMSLKKIIDDHMSGKAKHAKLIFTIVTFEYWLKNVFQKT